MKKKKIEKDVIQPELSDVLEMIHRYVAANKGRVCFIADFVAFDEEKIKKNKKDIFKEGADRICAFGDKETLRIMIDELRNLVEDEADEDGFVNL